MYLRDRNKFQKVMVGRRNVYGPVVGRRAFDVENHHKFFNFFFVN